MKQFLILLFLHSSLVFAGNNFKWKLIQTEDNLKIYEDINNKEDIVVLRATDIIHENIRHVVSALANAPRKTEWMPNYGGSRTLKKIDDLNRIEYSISDVPWPFNDRDFVFTIKTKIDPINKTTFTEMKSIEGIFPPQKGLVRGFMQYGLIYLKQLEKKKTAVEIIFSSDPKGYIPTWIVNYASRKFPYKMIHGLKKQASKLARQKNYYLKELKLWE